MTLSPLCTQTIITPGHGSNGTITRVVIHRMEAPLRNGTAAAVARYFQGGAGGRGVAAHYCLDPGATVGCVHEDQLAYHAPPNGGSIGIEQAGYCTDDDWGTPAGQQMLARTVALTADLCDRHGLPRRWLTAADIKAGGRGITSHHQVSAAYGQSSHTDPDPHFPQAAFIAAVQAAGRPQPPDHPKPPDKVPPMFQPPHVLQPIVDAKPAPEGGAILLGEDGSVYAYGGATFFRGANGQPWFAGRKAARLDYTSGERPWRITANTGEVYDLPAPT